MKRDISYREERIEQLEMFLDGRKTRENSGWVTLPKYLQDWIEAIIEAEQS